MGGTAAPQYFPRRGELDMEPSLTLIKEKKAQSSLVMTIYLEPHKHYDINLPSSDLTTSTGCTMKGRNLSE